MRVKQSDNMEYGLHNLHVSLCDPPLSHSAVALSIIQNVIRMDAVSVLGQRDWITGTGTSEASLECQCVKLGISFTKKITDSQMKKMFTG